MRIALRSETGAATAELALSTLVLVPIALYAMYVGEAFIAAIKAQEAEIAATWEVSAYRLHEYRSGGYRRLYTSAISAAERQLKTDLRDFDSYDDANGSGRVNAIAEYHLTSLECGTRRVSGGEPSPGSVFNLGGSYLHSDGWVGCQAKVQFQNRFLPRDAFKEIMHGPELLPASIARQDFCGSGNTPQGCRGTRTPGMMVLTDDWGLEDAQANPLGTRNNRKYYNVGESIYSMGGLAQAAGPLAILTGFTPLVYALDQAQTGTFKMAYRNRISDKQPISERWGGPSSAHVSPYHEESNEYTDQTAEVSRLIYGDRVSGHYMGKRDARWNGQ
jgi:hypothetical protein